MAFKRGSFGLGAPVHLLRVPLRACPPLTAAWLQRTGMGAWRLPGRNVRGLGVGRRSEASEEATRRCRARIMDGIGICHVNGPRHWPS